MKIRFLAALIFVAAFSLVSPVNPSNASNGNDIFKTKCMPCHGVNGAGNEAVAKVFKIDPARLNLIKRETQAKKDSDLTTAVKLGKSPMPAFGGTLNETDIKAVVQFIRSLALAK